MRIYNFLKFSIYWEVPRMGLQVPLHRTFWLFFYLFIFFFSYLVYSNINLDREFDQ